MLKRKSKNGKLNNGLSHCIRIPFQSHYVRLNLHSLFSALTTSSFRNPLGITFSYATRDLLLPMLSMPSAFTFSSSAMEIALHKLEHLVAVVTDVGSQGTVIV